ncbi:MAG: radical SAM protein, partial [Eggerthellaceae bacterium]|nr:radical SAM protein [Eggerthellaceae bacterium]
MERTVCNTCPRHCALGEGQVGPCHARVAQNGRVVAQNYGRATSLALDPVEKKPFSRWMEGSSLLSVGSYGCNLSCPFCQNHTISQAGSLDVAWQDIRPERLVEQAASLRGRGCIGIAYTYNELLVGWEYV